MSGHNGYCQLLLSISRFHQEILYACLLYSSGKLQLLGSCTSTFLARERESKISSRIINKSYEEWKDIYKITTFWETTLLIRFLGLTGHLVNSLQCVCVVRTHNLQYILYRRFSKSLGRVTRSANIIVWFLVSFMEDEICLRSFNGPLLFL